eukprot:CAMPEP_0179117862 /NCGR_PEP_ID=MMETSP0796-20121207/55387_1 /TAXON_ID=73915 /ORGANISM="Pyrodinium bahamense, Strain pbaha01" /LENGTH=55 /DNA_ID=CAMNT_0020816263 /DNA_START=199 /DNA_END=363 /DNA_ORIENTATION=-
MELWMLLALIWDMLSGKGRRSSAGGLHPHATPCPLSSSMPRLVAPAPRSVGARHR